LTFLDRCDYNHEDYSSSFGGKAMNKVKSSAFIMFFLFSLCGSAAAHHPTGVSGPGHSGPLRTLSALTIDQGRIPVEVDTEFIDVDSFSDQQLLQFAAEGKNVHSVDSIIRSSLGVGYGVTNELSIGLRIPYVQFNNIREAHADEPGEIHIHGDSKGIGDMTLLGQYMFLKMTESRPAMAVFFGVKIPTGETNVKDIDGLRLETEFQPGSGSWDPIVGTAITKRFGPLSIDVSFLYTLSTRGAQETRLGDSFQYNAAASYRAFRSNGFSGDLILEANGEWRGRQKTAGITDENSGENVIFLSPGARLSWKQWSAYVSVGLPILQDLKGIQNKTNSKTLFGITVGF
jgi:hypothetical protein